jgi:hypothetical protein
MPSVAGAGPVSFTDIETGAQYWIPLTSLQFDNAGKVIATGWANYSKVTASAATQSALENWLAHLAGTGALIPSATTPSAAAVITAKQPGPNGNSITIEISEVTISAGTFKATVTETDRYDGLDLDNLTAALNNRPGLVTVKSIATGKKLPKPTANAITTTTGAAGVKAELKVPAQGSTTATSFVLEAREAGADGNFTTVEIATSPADANKFTLIAKWTRQETIQPKDLGTKFGYVIEVKLPPGSPRLPAPGKFTLRNGTEAGSAVAASTTLMTA